jgi:DNA transformation protein
MTEYIAHLIEVFADFGELEPRRMFGGYGMYYDDIMIGLVADESLYLKTDDVSAPEFEEWELQQFEYHRHDKVIPMSYYMAPDIVFDNRQAAVEWGQRAYEAAIRSRKKK